MFMIINLTKNCRVQRGFSSNSRWDLWKSSWKYSFLFKPICVNSILDPLTDDIRPIGLCQTVLRVLPWTAGSLGSGLTLSPSIKRIRETRHNQVVQESGRGPNTTPCVGRVKDVITVPQYIYKYIIYILHNIDVTRIRFYKFAIFDIYVINQLTQYISCHFSQINQGSQRTWIKFKLKN